ncbi:MAG: CPBP family intramembrane metalloprotease [Mariprofundales bacterium]|nr:CPBP family intramembrane metalloprotease [Mariprofundales bacterium]
MAPLPSRLIWWSWSGVTLLEGLSWWLPALSQSTLTTLRVAELVWLGGVVVHYRALALLGLTAPGREQWLLLLRVAVVSALLALLLLWVGWLDGWLLLPRFIDGAGGVVLLLLLAPLVEELLFRALLYRMLEELVGRWLAIVGSALCFALAHGLLLSPQLAGGVLFAWLYMRSGNLWLPIILHAGANGALLLLVGAY